MYLIWKYVHIVGVVGFVAAHGTTATVALRLRRERDSGRIALLLELSRSTRPLMYVSLLLVVVSGVAATSTLGLWSFAWIWWSIVLLVAMIAVAIVVAVPYYARVRRAVTQESSDLAAAALDTLLRSPRALVVVITETAGVLAILWLMVAKPS